MEREEVRGDVVGFYHTHPSMPPVPSARDAATMPAWVSCFGKPLLCVIDGGGGLGPTSSSPASTTAGPCPAPRGAQRG